MKKRDQQDSDWLADLQDDFEDQLRKMEIRGEFAAEKGPVVQTIVQRAAWADLLVLSLVKHTGPKTETGYGTRFNKILQHSPRPVLVVPEEANSTMDRALLAYDGSPKADEALFLAAYMTRNWGISLVVLSAGKRRAAAALGRAEEYLDAHDVEASYVRAPRPADEAILSAVEEHDVNLLIMGGFGQRSALQMVIGSTVTKILRVIGQPVFVCR
jgi:nucleotide-binding universal stress UspA family protein